MTFSRRQLYAMGEPLGDSATYRKADGGLILGGGGGGGGSSAPVPVQTQTTIQDLPDWAKPYAQDILSKGKALTDINQNPYQAYGGQRIAGFTPLQEQSFQGAQNMAPASQIGQGTAGATAAGLGGLDVAGQATTGGFQNQVSGYMDPYLQMSLAPQIAEANRQYDIGATRQQGAATQAGAFGGSREAIMAAENERNRNMALNQIVGQGYNTAFTNAQNQYNQNLQNQLAGYGLAGQAAGQLGQLGQLQYGQQMGINQLQNQYGAQQQAQTQKGLDTAYQDFLTQKNYPYQQLSYMQNLIRGTPMGMNTASQVYQAPPTTAQTIGALGLGAYGLGKMFAEGGEVKTYAGDKGSVTSEDNVRAISRFLPAQQLPVSYQLAQARSDLDAQAALQKQMAENASIQRGLGGAFNSLSPQMQDNIVHAAGGGILAFADRGVVDSSEGGDDNDTPDVSSMFATRVADPKLQAQLGARQLGLIDYLTKHRTYAAPSKEDRLKYMADYSKEMQDAMGASPYGDMRDYIQQQIGGLGQEREEAKGLAALEAIPAILQPGGTARGLGAAAASIGSSGAKIAQNQRAAKQQLTQMQFNLADAERKERMGLHRDARAAFDAAQANAIAADKADIAAKNAAASNIAKTMAANKVTGAGGAGGKEKEWEFATKKYLPLIKNNAETKDLPPDQQEALAYDMYQKGKGPGYQGVTTRVESAEQIDYNKRFQSELLKRNPDIRKAQKAGDTARVEQIRAEAAKAAEVPSIKGGATAPAPTGGAKPIYATNGKERIVSTDGGQTWKPVGAP